MTREPRSFGQPTACDAGDPRQVGKAKGWRGSAHSDRRARANFSELSMSFPGHGRLPFGAASDLRARGCPRCLVQGAGEDGDFPSPIVCSFDFAIFLLSPLPRAARGVSAGTMRHWFCALSPRLTSRSERVLPRSMSPNMRANTRLRSRAWTASRSARVARGRSSSILSNAELLSAPDII